MKMLDIEPKKRASYFHGWMVGAVGVATVACLGLVTPALVSTTRADASLKPYSDLATMMDTYDKVANIKDTLDHIDCKSGEPCKPCDAKSSPPCISGGDPQIPGQAAQGGMDSYQIKWGDTLSQLSWSLQVPLDQLVQLNSIADPNLIYAGSMLKLR